MKMFWEKPAPREPYVMPANNEWRVINSDEEAVEVSTKAQEEYVNMLHYRYDIGLDDQTLNKWWPLAK